MIQEMRYVAVAGPADNVDWVIEYYLSRYEIHLEYASQRMKSIPNLRVFVGENPYQEPAAKANFFLELLGDVPPVYFPMTGKQAQAAIEAAEQQYEARQTHFRGLEEMRNIIVSYINSLRPFTSLDAELYRLEKMEYFNCLFGSIPLENFLQFEAFQYEDSPIIFVETSRNKEVVWGCFFAIGSINRLLAAYNFNRALISATCLNEELTGSILEIVKYWEKRLIETEARIQEMAFDVLPDRNALLAACHTVQTLHWTFAIKQYAAKTDGHYIFVGWMPCNEAEMFAKEALDDKLTIVISQDPLRAGTDIQGLQQRDLPPTKLSNPPVIRWFEFFVQLYGTPKYNEIDPTPILAIAYVLLFGMMFGDVGHGLGLALLGAFLLSRHQLGGIMIASGCSAAFFGLMYGSIFGIEDQIPALWRHPIQDISGTLTFAVIIGIVIILISMVFNMAIAFKQRDYDRLFFSPNGISGMVLYTAAIAAVYGIVSWVFTILPLTLIVAKGLSESPAEREKTGIGMKVFQKALGIFEILLAYLTNTLSFVRVGAFALSHAGMMHVVMMLSQDGSGNILIFILGNLIVMGIEGLLIGIQSLRLGFYEIFSRFYEGGGRAFESKKVQVDFGR